MNGDGNGMRIKIANTRAMSITANADVRKLVPCGYRFFAACRGVATNLFDN
jgi:hypothetical protein